MSARMRSCGPSSILPPEPTESSHICSNFLLAFIVPGSTLMLGVLLMYFHNNALFSVQRGLSDIQMDIKLYLKSLELEKEEQKHVDNKMAEISEVLPKLVVIVSRLRKEIKEEMAVRLDQGVVLKQESYKELKLLMQSQLEIYDSDKTGLTDYALGLAGGKILSTRTTETYNPGAPVLSFFGVPLCTQTNKAKAILQTSVMPGECWAVSGHRASAVIKLIASIYVTNISLEHIPKSLSPTGEIDSAPKEFSIWGLTDVDGKQDAHFFGQFVYNKDGPTLQTFSVQKSETRQFGLIEFKLHSNHGHRDYTCIYRIRVHGKMNGSYRQNHPAT